MPERVEYRYEKLKQTDVVCEATRRAMAANRSTNTALEVKLRKALFQAGIRGYRKNVRKLPGKPDIVFGKSKLAIFANGCYWHHCPKCTGNRIPKTNEIYWTAKFEANVERDQRNQAELEANSWKVLVIWECEIKADLKNAVDQIQTALGS